MRAAIFQLIHERLQMLQDGDAPVIRHYDIFNEQVVYSEQEQPFLCPAVFVKFSDIDWQKQLHGVREAVVTVRLHVVIDTRVGRWQDTVAQLSLLDDINRALHSAYQVGADDAIGNMAVEESFSVAHAANSNQRPPSVINDITLHRSITDHDFGELADHIEEYQCHVTDTSAYDRF